jgi:transposase-like protein
MGTVMESSHVPMRVWLQAIYLMNSSKKGISTRQLQRTFRCSMKTAWFLSHRVREAMADLHMVEPEPMGGAGKVVEADETYIGGKEKNKHKRRRTSAVGGVGKQVVFTLVERDGRARSHHVPDVSAKTLRPILKSRVDAKSSLMTDDAGHYRHMSADFARHEVVNHGQEEYVRGDAHTNTAENFFSILKRGLTGVYHGVSQQHLHRYLSEFDFRYTNRVGLGIDDLERADRALCGIVGKRLTYRVSLGVGGR